VRLYENLFLTEDPNDAPEGQDWTANINPNSLEVLQGCKMEPGLRAAKPGDGVQFERLGYFCVDPDTTAEKLVFNRTIGLRDTWAKIEKAQKAEKK
jgi:glutaminyl-tRNA synthetase